MMSVDSSGLLPDVYSRTSLFRLIIYSIWRWLWSIWCGSSAWTVARWRGDSFSGIFRCSNPWLWGVETPLLQPSFDRFGRGGPDGSWACFDEPAVRKKKCGNCWTWYMCNSGHWGIAYLWWPKAFEGYRNLTSMCITRHCSIKPKSI